jgi:hypothetical protein
MNEQRIYNYRPLFGHYFLELQKFFATFTVSGVDQNQNQIKPIVLMGSPQAAFRKINTPISNASGSNPSMINSSANLPTINFIAMDFRRNYSMENPYVRYRASNLYKDNFGREKINVGYSSQSWEITYQVSVWTDSYKQRDDIMSKIFVMFRTDLTLPYYPDPVNYPKMRNWMEFRMDDNFSDDTNVEDLQEKESRKIVRSTFTINSRAILPYDLETIPTVLRIEIENKILDTQGSKLIFSLQNIDGEEVIILS